MGRGNAVGIVNRYGLDGSGFERMWRQEILSFPHLSRPDLGPTMGTEVVYRREEEGVKAAGSWL
jgi:hypothetical protein